MKRFLFRFSTIRATQRAGVFALAAVSTTLVAFASINNPPLVSQLHEPIAEHADQSAITSLVSAGNFQAAFDYAFEHGDELFEAEFNVLDGVGANVGDNLRFTRVPRADRHGSGEWANHFPSRATGPNAQSCVACHSQPTDDGAGGTATIVHRDPQHSGHLSSFIQRSTPSTFALGAIQRLAEEMTAELHQQLDTAKAQCCSSGQPFTVDLSSKGVSFGTLTVTRTSTAPCVTNVNTANLKGIANDLVVRPFQWKGSVASIRDFNRDAAHNEIGMQAIELVGYNVDGDGDGVKNELTVGDLTAMTVYLAAQPRPTTKSELDALGLLPAPLTPAEVQTIRRGAGAFRGIGCTSCHIPSLTLDSAIFSEPSQSPYYRDATFPAGQNPTTLGVSPATAVRFDLCVDTPDNQIMGPNGQLAYHLGALRRDATNHAVVELFGDLKRHYMGSDLAEAIDEVGTGSATFLTRNLWGVGSTAPYLHDGRATTLTEAILEHGGEASPARTAFENLPHASQVDLIAFLDNLVLYKKP